MVVEFRNEILYGTGKLETARDIVVLGFIIHKSLVHLDLNASEFSLNLRHYSTEEHCRKYSQSRRHILYSLNIDLPKNMERSLRDATPHLYYEPSEPFHLGAIYVSDEVYFKDLSYGLVNSIISAENQIEKLRRCFNAIRLLKLNDCPVTTSFLFESLIEVLYPDCTDSNLVVEFAISLNFCFWIFRGENPNYVEFVLHHAREIEFNIWQDGEFTLDCVNGCIISFTPGNISALLKYGARLTFNSVAYFENLHAYLEDSRIDCLQQKNISHRRRFLAGQLLFVHLSNLSEDFSWKALPYIWRSIPDPCFTEREFFLLFEGVILVEEIIDMIYLYKRYVVEETVEIIDVVPRCLKHLCRVIARNVLLRNNQLPNGIDQLDIPLALKDYLNLEC